LLLATLAVDILLCMFSLKVQHEDNIYSFD